MMGLLNSNRRNAISVKIIDHPSRTGGHPRILGGWRFKKVGKNNVSGSSFSQHVTRAPNMAGFHGALCGFW